MFKSARRNKCANGVRYGTFNLICNYLVWPFSSAFSLFPAIIHHHRTFGGGDTNVAELHRTGFRKDQINPPRCSLIFHGETVLSPLIAGIDQLAPLFGTLFLCAGGPLQLKPALLRGSRLQIENSLRKPGDHGSVDAEAGIAALQCHNTVVQHGTAFWCALASNINLSAFFRSS